MQLKREERTARTSWRTGSEVVGQQWEQLTKTILSGLVVRLPFRLISAINQLNRILVSRRH